MGKLPDALKPEENGDQLVVEASLASTVFVTNTKFAQMRRITSQAPVISAPNKNSISHFRLDVRVNATRYVKALLFLELFDLQATVFSLGFYLHRTAILTADKNTGKAFHALLSEYKRMT